MHLSANRGRWPAQPERLPLPDERDKSSGETAAAPDSVKCQAAQATERSLVDTELRGTSGLDSEQRDEPVRKLEH